MITKNQMYVTEGDGWRHLVNAVQYTPATMKDGLPLVLFAHGRGEAGTDVNLLLQQGLPKVLNEGYVPPFDFVMIAIQGGSWAPSVNQFASVIDEAVKVYKIDPNKVYMTGLSAGGQVTFQAGFNANIEQAKKFAALAPLSAANFDDAGLAATFKSTKVPVWATCGANDSFRDYDKDYVTKINAQVPKLAIYTEIAGMGHGGWTDIYKGLVKDATGKTIWDFFKDKVKGGAPPPPPPPSGRKLIQTILLYDDKTYESK